MKLVLTANTKSQLVDGLDIVDEFFETGKYKIYKSYDWPKAAYMAKLKVDDVHGVFKSLSMFLRDFDFKYPWFDSFECADDHIEIYSDDVLNLYGFLRTLDETFKYKVGLSSVTLRFDESSMDKKNFFVQHLEVMDKLLCKIFLISSISNETVYIQFH